MSEIRPYADYIETELDWLGQVPSHWAIRPLGTYFDERRETVSDKEFTPLSVTMKGIVPQLATAAKTDNGDNRKRVNAGDFVINSRSDRKGSAGMSVFEGSVSVISTVLKPRDGIRSRFVHYLLRSRPFQEEYYRFGAGIVADLWSTRYSSMKRIILAVPPTNEQEAIADFLDSEIAQIDVLIDKQEELIKLLAERRQATITQVITKGLDRTAPTKPSGIPWLGEVAAHWTVVELKHVVDVLTGFPFKSEDFTEGLGHIPLLRGVNVNPGHTNWADTVRFPRDTSDEYSAYLLKLGDLVLGLDRPIVSSGTRVCSIEERDLPALLLQRVARIRANDRANQEFVGHVLSSSIFVNYLEPLFTGVSVPHMSPGQLREFKIALPPLHEQEVVARTLRRSLKKMDVLVDRSQRTVALLRERRSALISAAVTGQINVRERVATS